MGKKSTIKQNQPNEVLDRKILATASALRVSEKLSQQQVWARIENRIAETPAAKTVSFQFNTFLRIAASVLLIVVAGFAVHQSQEVFIETAFAEHKIITLPDRSTVTLNAGSALTYNKLTWSWARKIYFTGEGFFSVAKGENFEVISPNGITQVLGTEFNLISKDSIYKVACLEGKVRVSNIKTTSQIILTPGLQTELQHNDLSEASSFTKNITAWRTGEFYFEKTSLAEVLNTLELQYNIHIIAEKNRSTYTGYFTNRNLEEALKLVCLPLELNYTFLDSTTVKISTKN